MVKVKKDGMKETKEARFRRVAEVRATKALYALRRVGLCANRQSYKYTPPQVDALFSALQHALDEAEKRFDPPKRVVQQDGFAFDDREEDS